jgi:ERCC4-type nuclease
MVDNESSKVAWNASQGIIAELSNRRNQANTSFINGDLKKAMNTLISVKQSVIQSFKPDERTELENIEKEFSKVSSVLSKFLSNSFNNKEREAFQLAHKIASRIYSKYNDKLMDLLQSRGYLVGEQADASRMKF